MLSGQPLRSRSLARWLLVGLWAALGGCTSLADNPLADRPDDRAGDKPPNILLLVAEDLGPRIGAYGDAVARTPNLDALARDSMRMTRAFTTAGVCAPSRAALLMSRDQISFGAQHMRTTTGPLGPYLARPPRGATAFPEWLRRAGYYTFTDGKLDYQFSGVGAGSGPFSIWTAEGPDSHWRNRAGDQPFFGLINFMETHESGVMRPDGPPRNASHARTQQFRSQHGLLATAVTDPQAVTLPRYYPDLPEVREDLARHYDNIHAMDARVGRILAALEADGLASNTIVIWTSDHGDGLPRAKRELFDSGIRVPMLVRLPPRYRPRDWQPGGAWEALISFVDLGPTIAGWAGVAVPAGVHGRNLLKGSRRYIYAARDRIDAVPDRQRAVRDKSFKYIRSWHPQQPGGHRLAYRDGLAMVGAMRAAYESGRLDALQRRWYEPPGAEQLYDVVADPFELDNRIDDPDLAPVRKRLRTALDRHLRVVGDSAVTPELQMRSDLLAGGEIPVTPLPQAQRTDAGLSLTAADGASIGYRIGEGDWHLYSARVALPPGAGPIEIKAVRYGFRESPVQHIGSDGRTHIIQPDKP